MVQVKSIVLKEYGAFSSSQKVAADLGLDRTAFQNLFRKAVNNLSKISSRSSFIEYKGSELFRFTGIAGILTLSPKYRIEIVPKFLNETDNHWREDFLRIALITRHGNLFRNSLTTSDKSSKSDLYDIITHTWINLFESNSRSLLRTYINTSWSDFYLDGEVDEEDLYSPSPEGFLQQGLKLSRSNSYNFVLLNAAQQLRQRASSSTDTLRLDRAVSLLINANKESNNLKEGSKKLLRDPKWKLLMQLSDIILSNFSLGYSGVGSSFLPGYVLNTHEAWEKLMFIIVKKHFSNFDVIKKNYPLGMRKNGNVDKNPLSSTPDISMTLTNGEIVLADAKYKVVKDELAKSDKTVISSTDIYESMAFLKAANTHKLILFYPGKNFISSSPLTNQPVEIFQFDENKISAFTIGVIGISEINGFDKLCSNVGKIINVIIEENS